MKNVTKVTLFIATVCVALGILLSFSAFAAVGFDASRLSTASEYSAQNYHANEGIKTLTLNGFSENVKVVPSAGKTIEIEYEENSQLSYSIREEGSSLIVEEQHTPEIMLFNFDLNAIDRKFIIKVPATYIGSLELSTASGRIEIADIDSLESLKANTMSGGIFLENLVVKNAVEADSASGDIVCGSLDAATFDAETMSGRITVRNLKIDTLALKAVSGAITASIAGFENDYRISAKAVSGIVNVPEGNNAADKYIDLETTSGAINLEFG